MLTDDDKTPGGTNQSPSEVRRRRRHEMHQFVLAASTGSSSGKKAKTETENEEVVLPVPSFSILAVAENLHHMEDKVFAKMKFCRPMICEYRPIHFFGVYDGHGGANVASLCKERMHKILEEELECVIVETEAGSKAALTKMPKLSPAEEERLWKTVITKTFHRMDQLALNTCSCGSFGFQCGCDQEVESSLITGSTALVAVVTPNHIIVGNCGDSRAILCRAGRPVLLSIEHKPERPDERAKIEASGGRLTYKYGARVNGILAMSRAIGDKFLKPAVISEPEITFTRRHEEDEGLILGSDGLWDVVPNKMVCNVTRGCLREDPPPVVGRESKVASTPGKPSMSPCESAVALLANLALARGSGDNISMIVVDLKRR